MSPVIDLIKFAPASNMGFGRPSHPAFACVLQVVVAHAGLLRSPSPKCCDQHVSVVTHPSCRTLVNSLEEVESEPLRSFAHAT